MNIGETISMNNTLKKRKNIQSNKQHKNTKPEFKVLRNNPKLIWGVDWKDYLPVTFDNNVVLNICEPDEAISFLNKNQKELFDETRQSSSFLDRDDSQSKFY
jgi:hypothetical protein